MMNKINKYFDKKKTFVPALFVAKNNDINLKIKICHKLYFQTTNLYNR